MGPDGVRNAIRSIYSFSQNVCDAHAGVCKNSNKNKRDGKYLTRTISQKHNYATLKYLTGVFRWGKPKDAIVAEIAE